MLGTTAVCAIFLCVFLRHRFSTAMKFCTQYRYH